MRASVPWEPLHSRHLPSREHVCCAFFDFAYACLVMQPQANFIWVHAGSVAQSALTCSIHILGTFVISSACACCRWSWPGCKAAA